MSPRLLPRLTAFGNGGGTFSPSYWQHREYNAVLGTTSFCWLPWWLNYIGLHGEVHPPASNLQRLRARRRFNSTTFPNPPAHFHPYHVL